MSRKFIWDPAHWRFCAEEARTVADQMSHEEARTIMRRIAMDYVLVSKAAYFALWLAAYVVLGLVLAIFAQSLTNWLLG